MEVNLVADAREGLRQLIPLLEGKEDRAWREEIEEGVARWWRILEDRAMQDANPVNPQRVFHELSSRVPDRAILTSDSGSCTDSWARHVRMREDMMAALSGTLAAICPAVPYALAAKFAHPDRPVIASIGDGAMRMIGINSLIDIARYHDRWTNQVLVVVVLHNDDLNQVTWEQRVMSGDPKLAASQVLPDFPYARYAELLGLEGIRVDRPEDVGPGWDRALAAGRPALLEVITDPEVPPLPPPLRAGQGDRLRPCAAGTPRPRRSSRSPSRASSRSSPPDEGAGPAGRPQLPPRGGAHARCPALGDSRGSFGQPPGRCGGSAGRPARRRRR